ncbi:hypothetical protein PPYR_00135 [Photinus pyralis]|uniref:DDE Tnp4 domain-containing protein n=2 Tax=Photinus pyralis TaxID=7054 RepID=A0A5N4B0Q0_PHOPY|nr:protein ALP1-like [Photinus pyralis]XP_031359371.1 protein ALP1-like [Photinus pyralis]KAB0803165.1 hypothetical protein PPYR_00135 [Photinus pyralis]
MESSDSSDEELMVVVSALEAEENEKKRKRKMWVHPINMKRSTLGEFHHLFQDLQRDEIKFFQYFRMSAPKFAECVNLLESQLTLENTTFRKAISKEERLAVTLRFLATGDTFRTIAFSYRLGETTVRNIVHTTCDAIWKIMGPLVMPSPTKDMWEENEKFFRSLWNFPNCLAAIDGKHVITDKPPNSGSLYFNYKKSFSVILLAFVDAHCRFTAVDVGAYGRSSDGGVFANSTIGKKILSNALDIPEPKTLPGCNLRLPHVFVGDEAFPLHNNLMRPYPGRQCLNNEEVKIYNYRLSRARRVSENAFGILVKRFRIYQRHLQIDPDKLDKVILATCCLHNFLRNDTCHWTEEQHETIVRPEGIENIPGIGGASTTNAMGVRDSFKNYFNSPNGSVSWQTEMVRRGKRNVT